MTGVSGNHRCEIKVQQMHGEPKTLERDTSAKKVKLSRIQRLVILSLVNAVAISALLFGFEAYLKHTDPFLNKLGFDSNYYRSNARYYKYLEEPYGRYTWGHLVVSNSLGFRERGFVTPKPVGICRIMVLGDSLTWGVGLAVEQRYSNLAEVYLNDAFPDKTFEVLNFGLGGLPTIKERDILQEYKDLADPDLIVATFVLNDPQPRAQSYSVEKEKFKNRYGWLLSPSLMTRALPKIGLPQTARLVQESIDNLIIMAGIVPPWEVALNRVYEPNSEEWGDFEQALRDIKKMSDERNLPAPIFAILEMIIPPHDSTNYKVQDETLPIYIQWHHQAQRTADEIGFRTHNHEKEFFAKLKPEQIPVNELDGHPSAQVNRIYAKKLFDVIAADIRNGELCDY